jgi:putative FmdB family regulatory protein
MPIYAYQCPTCGTTQDVLQKASEPAPSCAQCGTKGVTAAMVKQVTAPSQFNLTGTGWYKPGIG